MTGFDINSIRIADLNQGIERTNEVAADDSAAADILYTSDAGNLKKQTSITL